ncbi:glycosyltransferase family 2 protein [Kocuria rhizophila]|nr:glycosyltransferase family 2 protein [Kocuria rhizophila]
MVSRCGNRGPLVRCCASCARRAGRARAADRRVRAAPRPSPSPLARHRRWVRGPLPDDRVATGRAGDEPAPARPWSSCAGRATAGSGERHTGLGHVRTPLALVLNSDLMVNNCRWRRCWTPRTRRHRASSPGCFSADGTEQHQRPALPSIGHQTVEWLSPLARWRRTRALHELVGHDTRVRRTPSRAWTGWWGAAMLLPVEQVRAVGAFDEGCMNAEEVEPAAQTCEHGVPASWPERSAWSTPAAASDAAHRRTWLVDARARYARRWGRPGRSPPH